MVDKSNKWALPEFGLISHAHHNTYKKLKLQTIADPRANQNTLESYQQGHDKGYSDGLNKAMLVIDQQKQQIAELIAQIKTAHEQKIHEKELSILQFVEKLCAKLIFKELTISSDTIMSIISQALKTIDSGNKAIRIVCHKKLYDLLTSLKIESQSYIVYEIDNHLSDFQFKIESDNQKLCYDFEQTLDQIIKEL